MIKSNELRIGNLVITDTEPNGSPVAIKSIHEGYISTSYKDYPDFAQDNITCGRLHPIPLTIEWLKKLGFEDIYDNGYDCTLRLDRFAFAVSIERRLLIIADPKASNQRAKGIGEIPIEYVHRLQNLVFAMTGEELTLKEIA